jgi:hypothetical protein
MSSVERPVQTVNQREKADRGIVGLRSWGVAPDDRLAAQNSRPRSGGGVQWLEMRFDWRMH